MKVPQSLVHAALASLVAAGLSATVTGASAAKGDNEKCAGIVKGGQNDCGTSQGACAGTVKEDRHAEAWIYVPKGTCAKIAGGTVTDKPDNVPGGAKAAKRG